MIALRHRAVVVEDDLAVRVDRLELADETEGPVYFAFRVMRAAENKAEFGDDAVFPATVRNLDGLIHPRAFPHFLENRVAGGLRAHKHHAQSTAANR